MTQRGNVHTNVTLRRVPITIVVVEKQKLLHILNILRVCL